MEKSLVNDQTSKQKLQRKLDRVKRYRAPRLAWTPRKPTAVLCNRFH